MKNTNLVRIEVIFFSSNHWYSKIIKWFCNLFRKDKKDSFVPSHVGINVNGKFREALTSGFVQTKLSNYKKENIRKFISYRADEQSIKAGLKEFNNCWGKPYGWLALLSGAIYTITNKQTYSDGEDTMDCSEAVTRILRAFGYNICENVEPDSITPEILYEELKEKWD